MSSNAYDFYLTVINEVVDRMKDEFINEGVSEDILQKLREIWEQKLKDKDVAALGSRVQELQQQNANPMRQQNYTYPVYGEQSPFPINYGHPPLV